MKPISHLQLTRKASFGVSAGVVAHTLWSSAAPALSYRLYAEQWQLSHVVTTGIFAIYPFAVVLTLVMFGDLSDRIGRRANMLYGLGASILGTLLFALAQNAVWLFAARFTMGIGVGLTAGAATAAMLDFAKPGRESATASIAAVAQAAGFAAALVMAGLLIEFAPFPTTLNFWLLFAVLIVLLVATMLLPRPALATQPVAWSPSLPYVPKAQRRAFMVAALTVATAYSHGVLILSIGGQVVHDLIGSSSALINGVALALFPIAGGMVGVLGRSIRPFIASAAGALVSSAAMLLLVLAVHHQSLTTLLIATTAAGVGYSLLFSGGLGMVNLIAPAAHRGSMLSGLYLFGYLAMGLVALAIGVIATWFGLRLALNLGAITISLMGFASLFGGLRLNQATATLNLRSFDKVVPAPSRVAAGTFNNHS